MNVVGTCAWGALVLTLVLASLPGCGSDDAAPGNGGSSGSGGALGSGTGGSGAGEGGGAGDGGTGLGDAPVCLPVAPGDITYYVDNTHAEASDDNPGTSADAPWATLGKAAATLVAGDTVLVQPGGTYDERVRPDNSGEEGSLLTFLAGEGERPKVRGFDLRDSNHVVVRGFEVTNDGMSDDSNRSFVLDGALGVQVLCNYVHDTTAGAVRCNPDGDRPCRSMRIHGNLMTRIGASFAEGGAGRAIAINVYAEDSVIDDNDISHIDDYIRVFGDRNVVRNNVMHDSYIEETVDGGRHIDGFQSFCTSNSEVSVHELLLEGNRFVDNPSEHSHFALINATDRCDGTNTIIVRGNVVQNVGEVSYNSDTNESHGHHHKYYNNTTVDGHLAMGYDDITVNLTGIAQGSVLNNVFVNAIGSDNPTDMYLLDDSGTSAAHHNLAYMTAGAIAWTGEISDDAYTIFNQDPLFVGESDFHLQPGSPAIDAGTSLTQVAAGDTGNGVTLVVDDAHFFQPGWGGTHADWIAVGTTDNQTEIAAIDYAANTITLAEPLTRSESDPVWLARNSAGSVVLSGAGPDLGAFEYDAPAP